MQRADRIALRAQSGERRRFVIPLASAKTATGSFITPPPSPIGAAGVLRYSPWKAGGSRVA